MILSPVWFDSERFAVSTDGATWIEIPPAACRGCGERAEAADLVETAEAEAAASAGSRHRDLVLIPGRLETASQSCEALPGRVLDAETIDGLSQVDRETWERFAELAARLGL